MPARIYLLSLILLCGKISAQYFYDIHTIQKIEISFSQSNWDYQLDTAKAGLDEPIMAQWVKINGVQFDTVGVKYKGNSSYNSGNTKNPIHISLDEYKNQSYMGYKDVKLGNNYADPSMIREVLSYNILSNYMDCPKSNFAQLYINGAYIGVYANDEAINKKFCADHFYSSNNVFVKCNPIVAPTAAIKSNLKTITSATDSSSYFNFYELKSNVGWNDFVALTNSVSVSTASLSSAMDMDRAIWMLAFNNVLINLDSYTGVFAQNYYLYKDNTQRYNPIMWDLNMSFGGFPFVGSSNTSMGSLSITNQQQLSATIHATDPYWPLINDVMANPMYKRMYIAHMRTIISEMFSNNAYQTKAAQLQATIDTAVQSDANKFYSYTQFQNAMTSNYSVGSYSVPGISNLMTARVSYLLGTADFTASTPTISTPSVSNTTPNYNSTVTITANVLNTSANAVYLGYRYHVTDKFTRIVMYDDGLHNDGASGDDLYGADIPVLSGQIQYYIYAENSNAGFFSPQRAEHEFHTITANATTPTVGSLVINEFLADNTLLQKDEYSSREDWIEIFNTSNSLLDLSNVYLSDNYLLPTKWKFPAGTTIDPNAYLMVWADDDSAQVIYHTNFILSKSGEQLMLSVGSTVLDSVTYGAQGSNISYGRCPNGTGSFINLPSTSFNGANCTVGVQEHAAIMHNMNVYPNPASHRFTISVQNNNTPLNLNITNTIGQDIYTGTIKDQTSIQTESWEEGIYFIRVADSVVKLIVSK